MSFATPVWLFGLALVPLALLAYQASRRRGSRYAVRYTAVPALKIAAGRRARLATPSPGCAGPGGAGRARAGAGQAAEDGRRAGRARLDHARDRPLALDVGDRRRARSPVGGAARGAYTHRHAALPGARGRRRLLRHARRRPGPSSNHDDARRIVDAQVADGATATGAALEVAIDALKNDKQNGKRPPSAIILLSDGKTTVPPDPVPVARSAGQLKIPIYTVALGTRDATVPNPNPFGTPLLVAPDPETLRQIAQVSGGKAFTAEDSDSLKSIYKTLGSQLGTKTQKKQITASFAIGGLVLLLGAAFSSLRWAGRLP